MNSAVYPEEVEHLAARFGQPERIEMDVAGDPEFLRAFRASLRRRRAEVAFLIRRNEGRILVTTKAFYPSGLFRIPTGGVKPGEAVEEAFWRELAEETGLQTVQEPVFQAIIEYRMVADSTAVRFATYLFLIEAPTGDPHCSDPDEAISEYAELLPAELGVLAEKLCSLGPNWHSWGVWRAIPHRIACDLLTARGTMGPAPSPSVPDQSSA